MNRDTSQGDAINQQAFEQLFRDACKKCFGYFPVAALSESDGKLMASAIEEKTGLVIGPKSLRNYSIYIIGEEGNKKENPSAATLDTLARYVLDAPYTTELERKKNESHYPYWFKYRQSSLHKIQSSIRQARIPSVILKLILVVSIIAVMVVVYLQIVSNPKPPMNVRDEFEIVGGVSLLQGCWFVRSLDTTWWNKRSDSAGHLSLFTLRGDNWQDDSLPIRNLVFRKIPVDCFTTTIDFSGFVPMENWQQAGLLFAEDSTFKGKVLRISLSYNDFFGGYASPPEILIQGIVSTEKNTNSNPEEFLHLPVFKIEPGQEQLVRNNLSKFAFKVEKRGNEFRFLYAAGPMKDFAFKEAISGNFNIRPRYVGLFAIQGNSKTENPIAARFNSFLFESIPCNQ